MADRAVTRRTLESLDDETKRILAVLQPIKSLKNSASGYRSTFLDEFDLLDINEDGYISLKDDMNHDGIITSEDRKFLNANPPCEYRLRKLRKDLPKNCNKLREVYLSEVCSERSRDKDNAREVLEYVCDIKLK